MRKAAPRLFGALLLGFLIAGCSSGAEDTTTSTETTLPDDTSVTAPATTTTEAVAADASCVTCHTDQATLQALAVEPFAGETLSEGEG
ncbi:MAG TPA: hypothetical protein VJ482_11415 [Acidimicrobiia bacterium]|nr:hypothetical protein [Acidimicrobiia bacterium]